MFQTSKVIFWEYNSIIAAWAHKMSHQLQNSTDYVTLSESQSAFTHMV